MVISQIDRGASSYIEVNDVAIPENYEIEMIKNNTFHFFLPTEVREIDGRKSLYIKVDGLGNLLNRFSRMSPGKKEVEKLLISIKSAMDELKEYMLKPECLYLSIDYIMYSERVDEYRFVYIPGYKGTFRKDMRSLFDDIMRLFDHKDREGVVYLYDMYSRILMENYTPELFCRTVKAKSVSSQPLDSEDNPFGEPPPRAQEKLKPITMDMVMPAENVQPEIEETLENYGFRNYPPYIGIIFLFAEFVETG